MADENQEEVEPQTNPTPEEPETPKEPEAAPEPQEEPKEAPKTDEPTEKEKRLYARLKKEEETRKKLEQELQGAKKAVDPTDIDKILAVQTATKGLGAAEIAELKLRATATGKSLIEAREDENFKIWRKAYKTKVEEENVPSPSTRQDIAKDEVKNFNSLKSKEKREFLDGMTDDERDEWLDGLTIDGVPIEQVKGLKGVDISLEGIAAFKKEKSPKPVDDESIKVGEVPKIK